MRTLVASTLSGSAWRALVLLVAMTGINRAQNETPSVEELFAQGRFEELLPRVRELADEWEAEVENEDTPANHLSWAQSLLALGTVEGRLNRHAASLSTLRLARKLAAENGATADTMGDILDALGKAEHAAGEYKSAENSLLEAINYRQQAEPPGREPWLSASRNHLALVYLTVGRYAEAGRIFHDTLARAGEDKKILVLRHGYLGKYFQAMRSYAQAADHLERALEFALALWGEQHPTSISLTGQLGLVHLRLGPASHTRARDLLTRAADLTKAAPESRTRNLALATYLSNLGSLELEEGDHERARAMFEDSLQLRLALLGEDAPSLAPAYTNIGYVTQQLGNHESAQAAYQRAAALYLESVGASHQAYLEVRMNLAECLFLSRGPDPETTREAVEVTRSALDIFDDLTAFGTERQRLNWLRENELLTLPCSLGHDPAFIANTILRTKARLLDSLLQEAEADDPETAALRAEFHLKQRQLDDLFFRFEDGDAIDALRSELTLLESRLRDRTGKSDRQQRAVITWREVQDCLPGRAAFVDFVRYSNLNDGASGPLSYGAILILPEGEPRWIPLGTEDELTIWLRVLRDRLEYRSYLLSTQGSITPPALRLSTALRRLHDLFWAPIVPFLPPETETIGISPDSSLNFLSFATLLDSDHNFLAENFRQIVYLSSGRDLLVDLPRTSLANAPWCVAAVPEFEEGAEVRDGDTLDALSQVVLDTVNSLSNVPGALEELKRLERLAPADSVTLTNASEQEVRQLTTSPAVLHLTTHGFFLPTLEEDVIDGIADFDQQPDRFYRSGLVFAEAKRAHAARARGEAVPFDHDGALFSNEVRSLPLKNTRLVTLSSCESGLGDSISGEGVLGLRRGFTQAGAANILISLWPVTDNSTPRFMEELYRLSLATDRIGQSLWEAQRRNLAGVDGTNEAELEEAVLRYGCFVLCQRGPLEAAVEMPELKEPFRHWWSAGLSLAALLIFLFTRRPKTGT